MKLTLWNRIDYQEAWEKQKSLFHTIIEEKQAGRETQTWETIFLCEHPHVFTLGKNGNLNNLLINKTFLQQIGATCFQIERGGDITYHGPGQIVGYPIIDLANHRLSLKAYIDILEEIIIKTIALYGIKGVRIAGATGVWIDAQTPSARKIAAIGVKASRFVTMHGFALNVNTDLSYFQYINPCGFTDKGVTSIQKELGYCVDMEKIVQQISDFLLQYLA